MDGNWPGEPEEGGHCDKSGTLERGVRSGSGGLQRLLKLTLSQDFPDGMSSSELLQGRGSDTLSPLAWTSSLIDLREPRRLTAPHASF